MEKKLRVTHVQPSAYIDIPVSWETMASSVHTTWRWTRGMRLNEAVVHCRQMVSPSASTVGRFCSCDINGFINDSKGILMKYGMLRSLFVRYWLINKIINKRVCARARKIYIYKITNSCAMITTANFIYVH